MRKMVTSDLIVQAMNATVAESAIAEEIPEVGEVATQQPAKTVTAEQVAEAKEGKNPESDLMETPVENEIKRRRGNCHRGSGSGCRRTR
jgi:hypothetical protein